MRGEGLKSARAVNCPLSIVHCPLLNGTASEAMRRAVRSDAPSRATRRARPGGNNFQLSTFNFQLRGGDAPLLPLTLQSYNTGEAKSSIWAKRCRAPRVFLLACRRSALIVNRLAANGLSPFALRPSPFALCPSPFALRPSPFALVAAGLLCASRKRMAWVACVCACYLLSL